MSKEISLAEVKKHNKPNDLWVIIEDKVYDLTKFLKEHPGGEDSLKSVAGRDGTKEFIDVGHSQEARQIMKKFLIGNLAACDIKKKKSAVSCREIGLAVGGILLGVALIYAFKYATAKN
ncbi:probable cytochrome b5 isoform X2 [Drosophila novamexicana]|uniref:probable cytochrome b5 isoform X2 n=1 Tax=Drosophila novamexicana TaxID=47314 RepID=UPI0011E600AB|nr:probable cytochrome b5 isoform X2 [Drosophila novamexicana]